VFSGHTCRHANKTEIYFLLRMTKESITLGLNRVFFQLSQRQSQMVTGVTVVTKKKKGPQEGQRGPRMGPVKKEAQERQKKVRFVIYRKKQNQKIIHKKLSPYGAPLGG
jgi:U3 small nucleolar RNA-associated protein 14